MPYPDIGSWVDSWQLGEGVTDTREYASSIVESYAAQLYLRKHLNQIHKMVYPPDNNSSSSDLESTLHKLNQAQLRVASMAWVTPAYQFSEEDPPATDILNARLRAKYWGAQVITYRPCIKMILDLSFDLRCEEAGPGVPIAQTLQDVSRETQDKVRSLPHEVWDHAGKGIKALVQSTQAFHGLGPQRPIITNVFGTAHA